MDLLRLNTKKLNIISRKIDLIRKTYARQEKYIVYKYFPREIISAFSYKNSKLTICLYNYIFNVVIELKTVDKKRISISLDFDCENINNSEHLKDIHLKIIDCLHNLSKNNLYIQSYFCGLNQLLQQKDKNKLEEEQLCNSIELIETKDFIEPYSPLFSLYSSNLNDFLLELNPVDKGEYEEFTCLYFLASNSKDAVQVEQTSFFVSKDKKEFYIGTLDNLLPIPKKYILNIMQKNLCFKEKIITDFNFFYSINGIALSEVSFFSNCDDFNKFFSKYLIKKRMKEF